MEKAPNCVSFPSFEAPGQRVDFMRTLTLTLLLAVLFACGGGGGGGGTSDEAEVILNLSGPGDVNDYLPLETGNYWHFRGSSNNEFFYHSSVNIPGSTLVNGITSQILQELNVYATGPVTQSFLIEDANGIANMGSDELGDPFAAGTVPYWEYRFPLTVGTQFTQLDRSAINLNEDLDGDGVNDSVAVHAEVTVEAMESVTVPAGSFDNVLRIHREADLTYSLTADNSRVAGTADELAWLAPGVGWIRRSATLTIGGDSETQTEALDVYRVNNTGFGITDLQADSLSAQVAAGSIDVYLYPAAIGEPVLVYLHGLTGNADLLPYLPDFCGSGNRELPDVQAETCVIQPIDQRIIFAVRGNEQADYRLALSPAPGGGVPVNEGASDNPVTIPLNTLTPGQVGTRGTSYYAATGLAAADHAVSLLVPSGDARLHVYGDNTYSLELDCTLRDQLSTCTVNNSDAVYFSVESGPLNRDGAHYLLMVSE
jgi:hypothetical protein